MKPEAVSESEAEWNRGAKSRKPNQDKTRGRGFPPAQKGRAGAPEHTAGSEHNREVEPGTPESGEGVNESKLNQELKQEELELDCADAEKFARRAGKPPPISGHVPWRAPHRGAFAGPHPGGARAQGKLDFTGRLVTTTGAG